jgi:hypothetical protein
MPFITKQTVTATNASGESFTHQPGTVLSDWELSDHIRQRVAAGDAWALKSFEPLTESEALSHRIKATALEGPRIVDGKSVDPPFEDYVGLHPNEIVVRLAKASREDVEIARAFERAGMNRAEIVDFVAPSEREPWVGYDEDGLREILEKLDVLDDNSVQEAIVYEFNHKNRPAIITFEKDAYRGEAETEAAAAA